MRPRLVFAIGALALCGSSGGALHAQDTTSKPNGGSTLAGVYSLAQATRGETVYKSQCLECHVPSDYTGDAFQAKFVGGTAYDMFEQIRSSMPQNNPGSLTKEQYTDLVAYLFQLNGLPTRDADMPAVTDSLKAIKVEAKPPQKNRQHLQRHQTPGVRNRHGSSRIR